MSAASAPRGVPRQLSGQVRYEERDGVGVWTVTDLNEAIRTGELDDGEEHFRRVAGQPSMSACVVVLEETADLDPATLDHVRTQWTELAEETGIAATAYVSDGLAKLAVSQKNQADIDTAGFGDVDEAVKWATAYQ